jgi:hypothetical protein
MDVAGALPSAPHPLQLNNMIHDITNIFVFIYEEVQWLIKSVRHCCENTMELAIDQGTEVAWNYITIHKGTATRLQEPL